MNNLWFIAIIGLLGLVSTIVSSKGSLYDKRFKWLRRLTNRGKIVAAIGLSIVVLSAWQYMATNSPAENPIIIIRKNGITAQHRNDSTIELTIQMVTRQAASKINIINYLCELHYIDSTISRTNILNLIRNILVPKEELFSQKIELDIHKEISYVNIALIGKYTREDGGGEFKLEELYQYTFASKSVALLEASEKDAFFKVYKIKID